jgi:hypothetical protein
MDIIERLDAAIKTEDFWVGDQREDNILKDSKKIIEQLRELEARYWEFASKYESLLVEIERLREALLDAVGFVSRADSLFLRKATTDTLKGIPDGYH